MTSSSYNGFPGPFRDKQGGAIEKAIRDGETPEPTGCTMCPNVAPAVIHKHCEDYYEPVPFIPLCYCCHMAVHRRFDQPHRWHSYLNALATDWRPPPLGANGRRPGYGSFTSEWIGTERIPLSDPPLPLSEWAARLPMVEPDLHTPGPEYTARNVDSPDPQPQPHQAGRSSDIDG